MMFLQTVLCDFQWLFWHSREQYHARPRLRAFAHARQLLAEGGCSVFSHMLQDLHASVPLRRDRMISFAVCASESGGAVAVAVVADRQGPHLGDLAGRGLEGLLDAHVDEALGQDFLLRALRDELEERVARMAVHLRREAREILCGRARRRRAPGSRSSPSRPRCPRAGPRRRGGLRRRRRSMFMHRATDRAFETWTPRQRNSAPPSIALPTVYRNMVLLAAFSMIALIRPTMCCADRAMFRSQSLTWRWLAASNRPGCDAAELLAHGLHRDRVGALLRHSIDMKSQKRSCCVL